MPRDGGEWAEGQGDSIVLIPVVVALAPVHTKIVEFFLGDGELRGRKWVAAESAELQGEIIGKGIFADFGIAGEIEVKKTETFLEVKHLQELWLETFDGFETVAAGSGAVDGEVTQSDGGLFGVVLGDRARREGEERGEQAECQESRSHDLLPQRRKLVSRFEP